MTDLNYGRKDGERYADNQRKCKLVRSIKNKYHQGGDSMDSKTVVAVLTAVTTMIGAVIDIINDNTDKD